MRLRHHSLILATVCLFVLVAGVVAAEFPFINDFEATPWEDEWEFIVSPWMVIDDANRITVFWNASIPHSLFPDFNQIYFHRYSASGESLSGNVMITDSSTQSNQSAFFPGSNYEGKWAIPAPVYETDPECWPFCYGELRCWYSDAEGSTTDTGVAAGNDVEPTRYNHVAACDVDAEGNFVVTWCNVSMGLIWCQVFDSEGLALTDTIRVSDESCPEDSTLGFAQAPRVAMTPTGDFVIVFFAECSECEPNWAHDVFVRAYYADGSPRSNLVCATCGTASLPPYYNGGSDPNVAIKDDGDFAVTWVEFAAYCESRTVLRRFNADATPKGDKVTVDSGMCSTLTGTYVASDSVGNLVVAWHNNHGSINELGNLYAQRFDTAGQAIGQKSQINNGYNNVFGPLTPVVLNNNGLVGFFWIEENQTVGRFLGMAQFMDLDDVGVYVSCDANNDRLVNITDAVYLINYIFAGGTPPAHECLGNANGDELVNITDAVALISYIFSNGEIVEGCPD